MAMLVAAVVVDARSAAGRGCPPSRIRSALAAGIGVGVSSSVIPYVTDQLAMARLSRSTYALMVSLLPAMATVIGVVVLAQLPSAVEALGRRAGDRRRRGPPRRADRDLGVRCSITEGS